MARRCFINPLERPSDWLSAILLAAARVSCSLLYKSKYHGPDRDLNLARRPDMATYLVFINIIILLMERRLKVDKIIENV